MTVGIIIALIGLSFTAVGSLVGVTVYIVMNRAATLKNTEDHKELKTEFNRHEVECRQDRKDIWKELRNKADRK